MEFREVVRRRRMVRRYAPDPVDPAVIDRMVEHAQRAPNAGFSQGWAFLVLDSAADVARFWESTGADPGTHNAWLDGMRTAPVVIVPLASRTPTSIATPSPTRAGPTATWAAGRCPTGGSTPGWPRC